MIRIFNRVHVCSLKFKLPILSHCRTMDSIVEIDRSDQEQSSVETEASSENNEQRSYVKGIKEIVIDNRPFTTITEGKAEVLFPSSHDVFYNPVQEFNRDLSVAVIKQFLRTIPSMQKGIYRNVQKWKKRNQNGEMEIKLLEALAASGLRSIRYAKEIDGLTNVIANDMSSQAYESILRNIQHNGVESIVEAVREEASILMHKNKRKFDIVDLDPYGTAAPFLDSAIQAVVDGGLLMVTCTDMAILCGNGIEACHAKYGAVSTKATFCHEMALRIVLQCIESHANRYGRYIEPILSVSADFYVRLFVQVFTGPAVVKKSVTKLSMVYVCNGCSSYHLQQLGLFSPTGKGEVYSPSVGPPVDRLCNICSGKFKVCGPIWSSKLHNQDFVENTIKLIEEEEELYGTSKRMLGVLSVVAEELNDCPLYHKMDKLCSIVHASSPKVVQLRSALLHAGYRVSISHALPTSIKTDAPQHVLWDVIREWARTHPGKKTFEEELSKTIMSKESSVPVSFEQRPDANPESRASGRLRFPLNPEPYWGPKARAKTSLYADHEKEKQRRFQDKRKKGSSKNVDGTHLEQECSRKKARVSSNNENQEVCVPESENVSTGCESAK